MRSLGTTKESVRGPPAQQWQSPFSNRVPLLSVVVAFIVTAISSNVGAEQARNQCSAKVVGGPITSIVSKGPRGATLVNAPLLTKTDAGEPQYLQLKLPGVYMHRLAGENSKMSPARRRDFMTAAIRANLTLALEHIYDAPVDTQVTFRCATAFLVTSEVSAPEGAAKAVPTPVPAKESAAPTSKSPHKLSPEEPVASLPAGASPNNRAVKTQGRDVTGSKSP
jgi:hypothetical protein